MFVHLEISYKTNNSYKFSNDNNLEDKLKLIQN